MITLSNGDKWIIDELECNGIDYREVRKGNIPETSIRSFIERLCKAHRYNSDIGDDDNGYEYLLPRKLTNKLSGGYWDCNFDVFAEVFGSVAEIKIANPWSNVYRMPWGKVIVVFKRPICGECDTTVKVYDCYEDYLNAVQYGWEFKSPRSPNMGR